MQKLLLVGLGGFTGAISRYLFSLILELLPITLFTSGTLSVLLINNGGSFLAGIFINKINNEALRLIFITGFLGSFTTFSAFSQEGMKLFYDKAWFLFYGFLSLNVISSLIFYHLGYQWSN